MFINTTKGITKPTDLNGRKVGVKTYDDQRGAVDARHPAARIRRAAEQRSNGSPSSTTTSRCTLPPDIKYTRLPSDKSVETMLAEGELDAVFHSDFIKPFLAKDPRVARLFPDNKAEEMAYFQQAPASSRSCMWSAFAQALAEEHPWLAVNLFRAFNEAKDVAMKRMANPRIVPLAWYHAGLGRAGAASSGPTRGNTA